MTAFVKWLRETKNILQWIRLLEKTDLELSLSFAGALCILFLLGNYLYRFTYMLGSWLGMLPGTWAYVSVGAFGQAIITLSCLCMMWKKWMGFALCSSAAVDHQHKQLKIRVVSFLVCLKQKRWVSSIFSIMVRSVTIYLWVFTFDGQRSRKGSLNQAGFALTL
ncbi:unnamed protein product, partial [Prunus brigantina]